MLTIRTDTIAPASRRGVVPLHEAAGLAASDVSSRLSRAIEEAHAGSGSWAYYRDHQGDDQSGDVFYRCDGRDMRCPYDFDHGSDAAAMPVVHTADAKEVLQRSTWEDVPDDEDEYTGQLEESFKAKGLYTALPLYERFISKGERDKADSSDFAGKGQSFPILKAGDVMAAVRSMGRAGSSNYDSATLKKNIIRIAKRKGWAGSLPKSWQDGGSKESRSSSPFVPRETALILVESATTLEQIVLREAKSDYEIKLIAPGKGSSAFYPAEVLKRDGPNVFKAGTHVYLNHPTAAEEAARPEGDVANLAGVLTTDAAYHEAHAKGPGLYARMKVFADHAQTVEEKAPFVGMSIRAMGEAEAGKRKDGVPVLKELSSAESVDVVTRAGAGGMILTEAARGTENHLEGAEMDADTKKLMESNKRLLERLLRSDAREIATRIVESMSLPAASRQRIVETVCAGELPQTNDELDEAQFTEAVNAAARREGEYVSRLTGSGRVTGMGVGVPGGAETDPAKVREAMLLRTEQDKRLRESGEGVFAELMGNKDAGKAAFAKGEAA